MTPRRLVDAIRVLGLALLPACAPPPPEPPPQVVVPPAPPASVAPSASAAPAPRPPTRRFVSATRTMASDLDDDTGPAPCDFDRSYRGKIGATTPTSLTLILHPGPNGKLEGQLHYDKLGPPLAVTGSRRGAADFTVAERGGGTFTGRCDEKGTLQGEYTLGKRKEAFALQPRPAEWPGLHKVSRDARVLPNHPLCAKNAAADTVRELEDESGARVTCLPRDPKRRKDIIAGAPELLCAAGERGFRVFGLADARVEQRANDLLAGGFFDGAVKEIQSCSGVYNIYQHMSLVTARKDLLVVSGFQSRYHGGAHPLNAGVGSTVIDLTRGAPVELTQLVDPARLRDVAIACLPFHAQMRGSSKELVLEEPMPPAGCGNEHFEARLLWGCDKEDSQSPRWSIVPEGVVIGSWANAHVFASQDGQGPVIPWSVLLRDRVLKPSSPLARLWAGVTAAPVSTPACTMLYQESTLTTWREATEESPKAN